jgi:hypothetical protein
VRFLSKTADLYVTGIKTVPDAWAGWGPHLAELDLTGNDYLPDMMTFVGPRSITLPPPSADRTVCSPALTE